MPTTSEQTATFHHTAEAFHTALVSQAYWEDYIAALCKPGDTLDSFETDGSSAKLLLTQHIPADELPAKARSFIHSDVSFTRTIVVGSLSAENTATVSISASAPMKLGTLEATMSLSPTDTGCTLVLNATASASIPFIASSVERKILAQLEAGFKQQSEFDSGWLDAHAKN